MKPEWDELRSDPGIIDMSMDSTEVVVLYVQWLYHARICVELVNPEDGTDASRSAEATKVYDMLAAAYVFGEKIMDPIFKNQITLKFMAADTVFNWCPGPNAATIVYEGTSAGSQMRRLISDMIAHAGSNHPSWEENFDNYPRETLVDIIKAMVRSRKAPQERMYRNRTKNYLE
jgi:hypothetical protein